ncbi:NUDIX domain-containing protein [Actinoplanes sp. TRM 88003]|uniref:NUDIX domain-containing protein n=1 Tax=Paractinoplanes aksuensis TaxID=2939490 RepID=A0ABT1E156_9ACTN|nr:NUDIX domain-containing protein [Actinoplanes aksuensis]MCO8276818.1 NUDIX domain-containing protein [Actinoplanes aksuensis]
MNPRHAARGIILDEDDRILLCQFVFPHPAVPAGVPAVWAAPGGGVESGEDGMTALRRELREETGLIVDNDQPYVWHQIAPGIVNDYYLVRTTHFEPRGEFTDEDLATGELLAAFRWWSLAEITGYPGPDLFSPRALAPLMADLLQDGPPAAPLTLGL